jgi:DNA-binding MarR family transcriptional regulator
MNKTKMRSHTNQNHYHAPTQWFHIFKAMFDQGGVAKIGPYAFTVYAVIKSHANYNTGRAGPGIDVIAAKGGISPSQVKRELDVLEAEGYITRSKTGRSNRYTLAEKIQITNEEGKAKAIASWSYSPSKTSIAVSNLKGAIETGELASTDIVSIRHLKQTPNVKVQEEHIDFDALMAALEELPTSMQGKLRSKLELRKGVIHSSE